MKGTILVIVLSRLDQRRANKFCKKFYDQDTSTRGKRYRRVGLLDGIPHIKLARGVVIVSKKDAKKWSSSSRTLAAWSSTLEM